VSFISLDAVWGISEEEGLRLVMSKRLRDTELWDQDWFLSGSAEHRDFWTYLCDKCDRSGVIRPNFSVFNAITKHRVNGLDFLSWVNMDKERIRTIGNGRWWITGFVQFQCGMNLKWSVAPHRGVIIQLRNNQLIDSIEELGVRVALPYPKGSLRVALPYPKGSLTPDEDEVLSILINKDKSIKKGEYEGETETGGEGGVLDDVSFKAFWMDYPRKQGKGSAEKAWKKIKSPVSTLELIMAALSWQKVSDQWTKDNGQYIPLPASYLNARKWEDEPAAAKTIKPITQKPKVAFPHY
jgi:hypothetical protein